MARGSRKSSPSILIVTHKLALEVDGVIDHLRDAGAKIIRLNLCEFPEKSELSLEFPRPPTPQAFDAGWFHDIGTFSTAVSLTGLRRDISLKESYAFVLGFLTQAKCSWLNEPRRVETASNKCLQLCTASDMGLPVPPTTITSSPSIAKNFARKHARVVVKTLSTGYVRYGRQSLKLYSHRLGELPANALDGLTQGPLILQAEIAKRTEVRVTVVTNHAYSVKIDCRALGSRHVDTRQADFQKNKHLFSRATDMQQIEQWSKALVRELGLKYAGLDWVIDEKGNPYFLECNPLGSFKWSEICSGFDITGSLANALLEIAHVNSRGSRS